MGSSTSKIEDNNTVFFVNNKGNNFSYHSVVKYADGYGMCDLKTKVDLSVSRQYIDENEFRGVITINSIHNEITDKYCYTITLIPIDNFDTNNLKLFDGGNNELTGIYYDKNNSIFCLLSDEMLSQSDYFSFLVENYKFY